MVNTKGVSIEKLAIDASHNTVAGCNPGVAGVHFFNSSGTIKNSAIFGAHLTNPQSCTTLPFGNGFGVRIDSDQAGPLSVSVKDNSIYDFTANGRTSNRPGITVDIAGNTISGIGPSSGIFQLGVFLVNGVVGRIRNNIINEGLCGLLPNSDCVSLRSEGIVLRAVGDGTVVDGNIITNAQSGIFVNGANRLWITDNQISNIEALSGIDIQGTVSGFFTNSVVAGNTIFHIGPIDNFAEGCGILEYPGTGTFSGNPILNNTVSDAYCGVSHVSADSVHAGSYLNTLYTELNSEDPAPPPVEP